MINCKKKSFPKRYFVNDAKLLHKIVLEDNTSFHVPVVPQALTKYVLHQGQDGIGHYVTARTFQCLK